MGDISAKHKLETTDHIQTFVVHYFRAEVSRETAWHHRLDITFDWAVVATGGMITFALSGPEASHIILLAIVFIILFFLNIEARRYKVYAKLKYRVRRIEDGYIAPLFNQVAQEQKDIDYRPHIDRGIIDNLLEHKSPISHLEAVTTRLRSNYIYLLGVIYVVWLLKIFNKPSDQPWWDFINQQAQVAELPGTIIFILFTAVILFSLILTVRMPQTSEKKDS
ncbi:MAG: DUF2270 domain-containing protein [Chloroflexota bacterium]